MSYSVLTRLSLYSIGRPHHLLSIFRMASVRTAASFQHDKAYINGKWVSAKSGKTFEVLNPSTGAVLGTVPDMDASDTEVAIEAANKAFESWKYLTAKERSVILKKWYQLMMDNKQALGTLLTLEMGKPIAEAEGEIAYSANFLEWFSEEGKRVYGDVIPPPAPNKRVMVIRQPVGVAGFITPWNFPSAMITRKAGPALAAGCTVVIKPSEDTPYSALALCELAEQAGVPPGVFNVLTSSRANTPIVGKTLCESPDVAKISFTGSTAVGKILLAQAASTVKKVSLELGGNAPFIIFDSADVKQAVAGLMTCKFRCSGQTCICANRILVQEGIYDQFIQALGQAISSQLRVGDGLESGTTQGPLINERAVEKVSGLVGDAVKEGAKLVLGGQKDSKGPNFFQPTLLSDVKWGMRITQEEIFGPVVAAIKFKTEQEAVTIANSVRFGLAAYFYTSDISQAFRVSEQLEYGMVGINEGLVSAPEITFCGWKESGLGTEGGRYGIDEYLNHKSVVYGGVQHKI